MPVTIATVSTAVIMALQKLLQQDKILLECKLNERTITHRLAMYLTDIFSEFDVDCEYNKMKDASGYNGKSIIELTSNIASAKAQAPDDEPVLVYPDIIVHKRHSKQNFIVIEVKKQDSPVSRDWDIRKLKCYTNHEGLNYEFGVFIDIPAGQSHLKI